MRTMSVASLEFVPATVTATSRGLPYNPTSDLVQFAFTASGASLAGAEWVAGSWDGSSPVPGTSADYTALCLVGPGGDVVLPVGTYQVSVKITDSPEIPVLSAYLLKIT